MDVHSCGTQMPSDGSICPLVISVTVLCPEPNALVKALRKLPILHDEQYAQQTSLYEYYDPPENTLVLP